jgi:hypothetical protein
MKTRHWILGAVVIAFVVLLILPALQRSSDGYYSTHRSIANAKWVMFACLAYRDVYPESGGKFPATLEELLNPPSGSRSPLESGEQELQDGWGKRLRYAVVLDENGKQEAYAWSERIVRDRTHLCGAKCTADGRIVMFGLPE